MGCPCVVDIQLKGLNSALTKMRVRRALIPVIMAEFMNDAGEEFLKEVRKHVIDQDYNFPALSFAYRARKRRNKTKWWIHMGSFLDKLSFEVKGNRLTAGALEGVMYNDKWSMLDLAKVLEHGNPEAHIPARPLFRRAKRDFHSSAFLKGWMEKFADRVADGR